jgi:hypothetical protein
MRQRAAMKQKKAGSRTGICVVIIIGNASLSFGNLEEEFQSAMVFFVVLFPSHGIGRFTLQLSIIQLCLHVKPLSIYQRIIATVRQAQRACVSMSALSNNSSIIEPIIQG